MIIAIDALYFLLLVEFALIMLPLTIYFFLKNRKHSMLYRKTLKELVDVKNTAEGQTGGETAQVSERVEARQPEEAAEAAGEGSLAVKVNKMHRIIDFQKGKILDLMCYKDIFDGAQKKLSSIQDGYNSLKSRLVTMFGESPENKGVTEMMETFDGNNKDLESYIEILSKENENLSEKFRAWEDELKKIWEEAEDIEGVSAGMDESKYGELMQEREKLRQTLAEFEAKLQEKGKMFDDMQKQYEDMEKEYMILYKQQQEQQQQQQPE
ncbi:MAG: hypothetical protein A2077_00835 [Nitrospirae bacterium GWC2_46_6]|nr:MAG: hypothetical protein A2077_00835 [Nitrospirae bacterium GWC2_46_6]HCL80678.1 hypothetical protein [Nitrospiraceae bacterium]